MKRFIPQWLINYGKHLPEAVIANIKYDFPSRKLKVIGVTGTDGKTTVVNMIYQILKDANFKVSMISTINAVIADRIYETGFHVTSPPAADVQRFLEMAAESGDQFMILEVTSHALSQFRIWGVKFEIGVVTNVTHEHLDYHKTFKDYLKAKARLIKDVKFAILNRDDPSFDGLSKKVKGKVVSFGLSEEADINAKNFPLDLKLEGQFNLYNGLAAAAVGQVLDIDKKVIKKSLEKITFIVGRMQKIKNNKGIDVVVDFAHTPNALEQVLRSLKQKSQGRLIAVFGAASERDTLKRPLMGEVSAKFADVTILTDEDPRFEDRQKIVDEIAKGATLAGAKEGVNLFKVVDRAKAIKTAIKMARRGDIVGIFGKGHEKSISYKGVEKPWSDQKVAAQALTYGRSN